MTQITITLTKEQIEIVAPLFREVSQANWLSFSNGGGIVGAAIIGQLLQQDTEDTPTVEFAYLAPDAARKVYAALKDGK